MPEQIVERDSDEIAAEAYAEQDAAEKGETLPPKSSSTPKKDDEQAGESTGKSEEQAGSEDKDGDHAKGKEDKADKESEAGKKDDQGESGTDDKTKEAEALDKKITEYAGKHGMTYAEAKEDIDKTEEILKQYKNDPAEMARAMRNKDREYQKLRLEAEKAAKTKEPQFKRMTDKQFVDWAREYIPKERPEAIESYRQQFPHKSESMSDEAIVEELAQHSLTDYKQKADAQEANIKTEATKKRDKVIAEIPEADRRFLPEIKAIILEVSDNEILDEEFNISYAINQIKGEHYDADIKAAEERGAKRASEKAQIIGVKSGSGGTKPAGNKVIALTDQQKQRAIEMFGSDADEEKCYEMFRDSYQKELAKNPKFDPYIED